MMAYVPGGRLILRVTCLLWKWVILPSLRNNAVGKGSNWKIMITTGTILHMCDVGQLTCFLRPTLWENLTTLKEWIFSLQETDFLNKSSMNSFGTYPNFHISVTQEGFSNKIMFTIQHGLKSLLWHSVRPAWLRDSHPSLNVILLLNPSCVTLKWKFG